MSKTEKTPKEKIQKTKAKVQDKKLQEVTESFELGRYIKSKGFEYILDDGDGLEVSFEKQIDTESYYSLVWEREEKNITFCLNKKNLLIVDSPISTERLFKGRVETKEVFDYIYSSIINITVNGNK
jgi:hypothetical protein